MQFAIAVYDALVAINVPADRAKAVVTALEHDMTAELGTKTDLRHLELALKSDIKHLSETFDLNLKALGNTIVIRLTVVMVAVVGLATTFHRLF